MQNFHNISPTADPELDNLTVRLLNVKIFQLQVQWLRSAMIDLQTGADPVYKVSCCYFVFAKAAADYRDVPYALKIARFYAGAILNIVEEATGEKVRELSDQINGRANSIPTNLLFWCDAIEKHKDEVYEKVLNFIRISSDEIVSLAASY